MYETELVDHTIFFMKHSVTCPRRMKSHREDSRRSKSQQEAGEGGNKNAQQAPSEVNSMPSLLYQVIPKCQTSVCRLIGSERGYDISAVMGRSNSHPW